MIILLVAGLPLLSFNIGKISHKEVFFALRPFAFLSNFIQGSLSQLASGVQGTANDYFYLVNLGQKNRKLLKKNSKLQAKLGTLVELELENERLKKLLAFKKDFPSQLLAAQVIGNDLLPEHHTLTINRGTKHGIKKNMAAITEGGVIGYIIRSHYITSQVLLLTDRYASIDAIVQRTRTRGLVEGFTKTSCQLNYVNSTSINKGDLVVTSGLQGIFPKGFPIATVEKVEKTLFGRQPKVQLKPIIDPLHLEELFIILNTQRHLPVKKESK